MVSSSHPKAGEYNRRAKMRQGIMALATLEGWQRIDVLEAFIRPDGSVIVIDTDNRRYVTDPLEPVTAEETVTPQERPGSPVGKKPKGKKVTYPKLPEVKPVTEADWDNLIDRVRNTEGVTLDNLREVWAKKVETAQERTGKEPKDLLALAAYLNTMPDVPEWIDALGTYS